MVISSIAALQLWQLFPDRALSAPATTIAQNIVQNQMPFETLERGSYSGISEPFARVISARDSWNAFWRELHGNQIPIPPIPEIDFTQKTIVAVGMGERNSGGYGIEIESAQIEAGTLAIYYRETTHTCGMVTMAFTQPYHLAIVDLVDLPIQFFREREEIGCDE
ncbi:protease complex subunit PrcB family protein [Oscillatoriales cyanobacterium LEGE 11467]|uniref:Protease complex subunit PrcB family protein n=1 Tax=Zarconia navalis LEGE 11467 TaxID=1828826 RepID=A0A928VYP4_9CYAN|nr:protease complex subunit PrcB family protein [Zarconia navalis]MBE9041252.1 protease complex subunit PrcB family protein [Zarconia navalis LEGE 11467]